MSYLFTSESVSEGHPDKVADQISDAILDHFLAFDPYSKVACETLVTTGQVVLAGEVKSETYLDIQQIARDVINRIGYTKSAYMFEGNSCGIFSAIHEQSSDINQGVDRGNPEDQGAGDQGMMFGFACNETEELMPMPISAAHKLALRLTEVRKNGTLSYLRPDGKTQVTIEYDENDKPVRVDSVLISTQHDPEIDGITESKALQERIATDLKAYVINPVFKDLPVKPDAKTTYLINPSGRFVVGGPHGDAGLTGRKIIVDTYGGYSRHGGGAFSGKDPTKVDRSAAYAARYVAKNVVGAGLADKCEVQIAYAIGVPQPVSIHVTSFGTGRISDDEITSLVKAKFDLRPGAIIQAFGLRELPSKNKGTFYSKVAAYGHFGRPDLDLPWERLDKVEELKKSLAKATSA